MTHNGQRSGQVFNGVSESYHPTCWIMVAVT